MSSLSTNLDLKSLFITINQQTNTKNLLFNITKNDSNKLLIEYKKPQDNKEKHEFILDTDTKMPITLQSITDSYSGGASIFQNKSTYTLQWEEFTIGNANYLDISTNNIILKNGGDIDDVFNAFKQKFTGTSFDMKIENYNEYQISNGNVIKLVNLGINSKLTQSSKHYRIKQNNNYINRAREIQNILYTTWSSNYLIYDNDLVNNLLLDEELNPIQFKGEIKTSFNAKVSNDVIIDISRPITKSYIINPSTNYIRFTGNDGSSKLIINLNITSLNNTNDIIELLKTQVKYKSLNYFASIYDQNKIKVQSRNFNDNDIKDLKIEISNDNSTFTTLNSSSFKQTIKIYC